MQTPVLMCFRRHGIWHQRFTPGPEQAKFKWFGQSMCTVRAKCAYAIYMYIHMLKGGSIGVAGVAGAAPLFSTNMGHAL